MSKKQLNCVQLHLFDCWVTPSIHHPGSATSMRSKKKHAVIVGAVTGVVAVIVDFVTGVITAKTKTKTNKTQQKQQSTEETRGGLQTCRIYRSQAVGILRKGNGGEETEKRGIRATASRCRPNVLGCRSIDMIVCSNKGPTAWQCFRAFSCS